MVAPFWTDADTNRACEIWREYQSRHDVSQMQGQTAGIDPVTERIWFGESAAEIATELEREGLFTPLYFVRVGFDYYLRKGAGHGSSHVCAAGRDFDRNSFTAATSLGR